LENFLTNLPHPGRVYPNTQHHIYEGDTCNTLYYIIEGSVSVAFGRTMMEKEVVIAYLQPWRLFFGEMALFQHEKEAR